MNHRFLLVLRAYYIYPPHRQVVYCLRNAYVDMEHLYPAGHQHHPYQVGGLQLFPHLKQTVDDIICKLCIIE